MSEAWSFSSTAPPPPPHPSFLCGDVCGQLSGPTPQHSLSASKSPDTSPKLDWLTELTHTFSYMYALTEVHYNQAQTALLNLYEYEAGQAGRFKQRFGYCIAGRNHYNWSVFQSLSFSGNNSIKVDRTRSISLCQVHGPMLHSELCIYQLWLQKGIEHCLFFTSSSSIEIISYIS